MMKSAGRCVRKQRGEERGDRCRYPGAREGAYGGKDSPCFGRGVMTVFFALLSVLFLGIFFVIIESVRYQGLRAHSAQVTDMGNYSLFGEYEKKLLTDFDLFAVDGAYGTGDFSTARMSGRLENYLRLNTNPRSKIMSALTFDLWKLNTQRAEVTQYTLLSDGGGEGLYQEAVAFMHKTALMNATGKLLNWYRDAQDAGEKQDSFEKEQLSAEKEMQELEQQEAQKKKELEEQAQEGGKTQEPETEKKIENPLPALRRLARKDILTIVCGDMAISEASVGRSELFSGRRARSGNLPVSGDGGGLVDDLIFREYLLDHLACALDTPKGGKLSYELEYLLGGKLTDRKNLKSVVRALLLVREGFNYFYCSTNETMRTATGAAAAALIGWTGIPALTAILQHTLLLAWAYAESLLDVRGLMAGGKVPLMKTAETWMTSLENLSLINELLDAGGNRQQEGLSYRDYLRLLMNLQGISQQKKRTVDLVELRLRGDAGLSNFRADQCVIAVRDEAQFSASPLFSKVTGIFLGQTGPAFSETVAGGFSYLM